ncbi:MAG TPA: hydroxymethylpyrimidine/phosphomethylpyrimidine kinase [Planctomycetota bacterium]
MRARVLVVAGHDPTGGAGVDADRAACARFGAEAECVVSAWTEQDGERVRAVTPEPVARWLEEARYALADPADALKSGLLPSAAAVQAFAQLADEARRARAVPVVVDPVLAASGGEPFLDAAGVEALLTELLPRRVVLTPNLPEAACLAGQPLEPLLTDPAARLAAAEALLARGAAAVLLKGGHGRDATVRDLVLSAGAEPVWIEHPRHPGRLHGSGCRYASAVAAQLARAVPLPDAARAASAWLGELLRAAARPPGR